ncbi:CYTH domain-containing protein [Eubacterium oxidoreducens]|uniref:CYTH domain-containing protein n=1 Tax=Eubacterium oxidoreducens TaxID=1732 RepID=A0A1G6ABQ2_EUBOX|nr:CYTH domain-containing protein [Eubacterium oxidoreducens]SDB05828.1 CYTH domain-containing protein [Eubacterium oxidoreducens]
MEIERRFLIDTLPNDALSHPFRMITQGYLNTSPAIRVRCDNDQYYMTYKGRKFKGSLAVEEYNLPLNKESYEHLLAKADGYIISKKRYLIPDQGYTIELDVFEGVHAPLIIAEVEFPSDEEALRYLPPSWFGEEITGKKGYSNSYLSAHTAPFSSN